jgi:hypothetical protein
MSSDPSPIPHDDDIEKIAGDVLRYLEMHPSAKDTREGIARWWIARQRITESLEAVDAALAWLRARGEVHEITLPDGTSVYGRTDPTHCSRSVLP